MSFHLLYQKRFNNIQINLKLGSKNKLKRFKENETFSNVFQPTREVLVDDLFPLKGKWSSDFFKNKNPIVVELGCGKGEYSVELAKRNPERNYIGIDTKGARFWRGAKTANENDLSNVAFVRAQIELLCNIFSDNEIDEIWITFPDPQIHFKRTKHRLTNLTFLKQYKRVLKNDGFVHLKTDSEFMHGYTLGILNGLSENIEYSNHDIYNREGSPDEVTSIKTFYENIYLNEDKAITYVRFKLNSGWI